ncbi:MAG: acetolactate synthase 3 large subunit, partial [Anderseniella sp.]|nr:acetolactate synthase 3 large subunit [Anderseniella sp.]
PIVGDVGTVMAQMIRAWKARNGQPDEHALKDWWNSINTWRNVECLKYKPNKHVIMPQYAIERLYELTKDRDTYITTEVGQHQMWAAQFYRFEEPNRWMTSGGLGTMGYGLPAALGVQVAHRDALVIDIAGDASVQMVIQEMSSAVQYELPFKIFILNNSHMGMVRQWQQLLHGNRLSHSYTEAMPDFVKLAEAYGATGIRCTKPDQLDDAISEMIDTPGPVIFDCVVANLANCFPMIPSGKAHNEMLLGEDVSDEEVGSAIDKEGKMLV